MKLVITKEEKEKTIHAISRMLNGFSFHEADEILNEAREEILGALKITFPEDEQVPSCSSSNTN